MLSFDLPECWHHSGHTSPVGAYRARLFIFVQFYINLYTDVKTTRGDSMQARGLVAGEFLPSFHGDGR